MKCSALPADLSTLSRGEREAAPPSKVKVLAGATTLAPSGAKISASLSARPLAEPAHVGQKWLHRGARPAIFAACAGCSAEPGHVASRAACRRYKSIETFIYDCLTRFGGRSGREKPIGKWLFSTKKGVGP